MYKIAHCHHLCLRQFKPSSNKVRAGNFNPRFQALLKYFLIRWQVWILTDILFRLQIVLKSSIVKLPAKQTGTTNSIKVPSQSTSSSLPLLYFNTSCSFALCVFSRFLVNWLRCPLREIFQTLYHKELTHIWFIVPYRLIIYIYIYTHTYIYIYRGADKFLARTGRKQATVSVRMAWISFSASCLAEKNWWQLASRYCWNRARPWHASELVSFLVGQRTYQHQGTGSVDVLEKCVSDTISVFAKV